MNTDVLIAELSRDLRPVPIGTSQAVLGKGFLMGAALTTAMVLFWPSLGIRHDLGSAMLTGIFWVKLLYTGALACLGFRALDRLSRPGLPAIQWSTVIGLPPAMLMLMTLAVLSSQPSGRVEGFWMGSSALQCTLLCALLSVPIFAGLLSSLARLAPTRLGAAGAAAGLVAGATSASLYALHCVESSPGFVLLWYSVGLGIAPVVGATIGGRVLRW